MPVGNIEQIIFRFLADTKNAERGFDRVAKKLRTFGAALTATSDAALIAFAKLGEGGAGVEQLEQKFANVSAAFGRDADKLIAEWDRAAGGTLARAELMAKANYLALTGIPIDELDWMLSAVRNASAATGRSMTDLFDRLALGLARSSKLLLDDLGIMTDVTMANARYAKEIGKSADALTDHEKKLAFLTEARRQAARQAQILGDSTGSAAQQIEAGRAAVRNLTDDIKKLFIPVAVTASKLVRQFADLWDKIPDSVKKALAWVLSIGAAIGAVVGPILTVVGLIPLIQGSLTAIAGFLPYLIPIIAAVGAIVAIVALLAKAWKENWGHIQTTVKDVIDRVKPYLAEIAANVRFWIEQISRQLKAIMARVREFLEPVFLWIREQLLGGLGIEKAMITLLDFVTFVGSTIHEVLEAIRAVLEGRGDEAWRPLEAAALNAVTLIVLIWKRHIAKAATWGWNLIVNFANGIIRAAQSVLSQAATFIGNILGSFLAPGSPPKRGPLSAIVEWGKGLMETFLRAFRLADFGILRDAVSPIKEALDAAVSIGDLTPEQAIGTFRAVRTQVAELIADFRRTGEVSEEMIAKINAKLGEGGEEYTKYLRLMLEHRKAVENLASVEDEVAAARARGFVPRELEDKLQAAKDEVDSAQEAVDWQREYLAALQDGLNLQVELIAALKDLTKALKEKKEKAISPEGGLDLAGAKEQAQEIKFAGFSGFSEEFQRVREEVRKFFEELPGRLRLTGLQLAAIVTYNLYRIYLKIREFILKALAGILWWLLDLQTSIKDFFRKAWAGILWMLLDVIAFLRTWLLTMAGLVTRWLYRRYLDLLGAWAKIRGTILMIGAILTGKFVLWTQQVKDKMDEIYTYVTETVQGVVTWFGERIEDFRTAGEDLIGGFLGGIQSKWGDLKTWFSNRLADIPEWAKKAFGLGSDSKLFYQFGQWVVGGFEKGLDFSSVESRLASLAPSIRGSLSAQTAGGQVVVVQIGELGLPGIRDGRDANGFLRQLLDRSADEAALRGVVPGGLLR